MMPFGMPGPGGSLGECALCGKPFLAEILLCKEVKSFTVSGSAQTLYGHDDCLEKFEGKDFTDLPPESALRRAYERAKSNQPSAASRGTSEGK
jgi:hypothetical protein